MNLILQRTQFTPQSTIGCLAVNGVSKYVTLEPPRDGDPYCCIPTGSYIVKIVWSPKHKRLLPQLQDVPGRTVIEMHIGNTAKDTEGCILVGTVPEQDEITGSTLAFGALYAVMYEAHDRGEEITILVC